MPYFDLGPTCPCAPLDSTPDSTDATGQRVRAPIIFIFICSTHSYSLLCTGSLGSISYL